MHTPECVSNTIVEVHEIILIDAQQVASVEVQITFLEDVMQLLFLSLIQVSHITNEWSFGCYFSHQKSRFT